MIMAVCKRFIVQLGVMARLEEKQRILCSFSRSQSSPEYLCMELIYLGYCLTFESVCPNICFNFCSPYFCKSFRDGSHHYIRNKIWILILKMKFSNFCCNTNLTILPTNDYSSIIKELSLIYCMDEIDTGVASLLNYCLCFPESSPTKFQNLLENKAKRTEIVQEKECNTKSIPQVPDQSIVKAKSQASLSEGEAMAEESKQTRTPAQVLKKRKRRNCELDIRPNLIKLREHILSKQVVGFASKPKKAKSSTKKLLRRRSKYIGVSKNNENWQALINVDKVKNYIGTFVDELEAAKVYDLYSVAIRGDEASLNFDYTAEEMLERIECYLEHKSA
ncbi:unnamed protein product [Moneuplotes crassus]|uniref:AP2/ERF domain-containing protein n=1 Tax=Euplotes crassus TaxID=5936 RepID=A0AAD1XLK6_EUPCR|nr:unnamed protein product [Moneuplotes crassus]